MAKSVTGHIECKAPEERQRTLMRKRNWQQRWQPPRVQSICGLTEAKAYTDEEGFTAVRPEKTAKLIDCGPALKTSMLDCCPVLTVKSGAFECLQDEEEDDEEEQVPGFQSQASLYEEKNECRRSTPRKKGRTQSCRRSQRRAAGVRKAAGNPEDDTQRCR